MRLVVLALLVGCGQPVTPKSVTPSAPSALPPHQSFLLDTTPKQDRRMVPPEVFLRAYLEWFGGLDPREIAERAKQDNLFDNWKDYLAALGLPDYQLDLPRTAQSNTIMLATIGRLSEALCIRSAEHDLVDNPPLERRVIFAFDEREKPTRDEFAQRFDVLHRTFLSYPATLAPTGRTDRFYTLFRQIAERHAGAGRLTPERTAWVAICTALVQHPETGLY